MGIHGIQTSMSVFPRMQCSVQNEVWGFKTISRWLFYFCIDSLGRNSFHLHSSLFRLIIKRQEQRDMSFLSTLLYIEPLLPSCLISFPVSLTLYCF